MKTCDLTEFTQMLTGVCVLHGKPASEALIELYWTTLQPFEFREVKAAFQAHLSHPDTGQFMPKPADVIRYVSGSSLTQALQAWSKVMQAIRRIGAYSSVVFDDPMIHAVIIDMGGWISLCQTRTKDLPFRAHEFEKRYVAYVLHPPSHYVKQLVGLEQRENGLNQNVVCLPLLVGDTERALGVLKNGSDVSLKVSILGDYTWLTHQE